MTSVLWFPFRDLNNRESVGSAEEVRVRASKFLIGVSATGENEVCPPSTYAATEVVIENSGVQRVRLLNSIVVVVGLDLGTLIVV